MTVFTTPTPLVQPSWWLVSSKIVLQSSLLPAHPGCLSRCREPYIINGLFLLKLILFSSESVDIHGSNNAAIRAQRVEGITRHAS